MILGYLGAGALLAGLVMGGFSAAISFWAGWRESDTYVQVGRRAFYAATAMTVVAAATLETALLTHDFSLAYVTEHTDLSTPTALVAAGFYGGQEGSLLYWTLVLGLIGSASLVAARPVGRRVAAYAAGILAVILSFFLFVLAVVASPFDLLAITPPDGLGLNPVLRDTGMLIHPPVVLAGFAAFAIPFSFAAAALLAGRADTAWLRYTRRFVLLAWTLQTTGLLLGMWWAYHVLGWGGYWGWDPVENVALMPWLATTAYLHSSQVQEKRGRLRAWNLGLVIVAFLLVIFGTFVVRSGIVPSVHTFAVSAIGPWFLVFLGACVVFSTVLLALKGGSVEARERKPAPAVSREGAFVLQNVVLVGTVAVVMWGTILPLVSGMLGAERVADASYYERAAGPLFVLVLALLAAGPMLPWRRAGAPTLRALRWPAAAALVAAAALIMAGSRSIPAVITIAGVAGGATTAVAAIVRGARRPRALLRQRRRYGAYLAHVGLVVVAAGIAGSHFWQQEKDVTLAPGAAVTVAGYTLSYQGTEQRDLGDHSEVFAALRFGDQTLEPSRAIYPDLGGQALTHVAITTTPVADVYVVLVGVGPGGSASFRVFVNPLVSWIWAGGVILILGVVLGSAGERSLAAEPARWRVPATFPA